MARKSQGVGKSLMKPRTKKKAVKGFGGRGSGVGKPSGVKPRLKKKRVAKGFGGRGSGVGKSSGVKPRKTKKAIKGFGGRGRKK